MPVRGIKFCDACNKYISAINFATHKKTKVHRDNVEKAKINVDDLHPEDSHKIGAGAPNRATTTNIANNTNMANTTNIASGVRRDYQLIMNEIGNQYPQYRLSQDQVIHRMSKNDATAKRYRIDGDRGIVLDDMKDFIRKLNLEFKTKMRIGFTAIFKRPSNDEEQIIEPHFYLDPINILDINSLDVEGCISKLNTLIQEFEGKGSGWSLDRVKSVTIHYYKTR